MHISLTATSKSSQGKGIIQSVLTRISGPLVILINARGHGLPAVCDVTGGTPAVANSRSPCGRIVHAPLAPERRQCVDPHDDVDRAATTSRLHGKQYLTTRGIQSVAHGRITGLCGVKQHDEVCAGANKKRTWPRKAGTIPQGWCRCRGSCRT